MAKSFKIIFYVIRNIAKDGWKVIVSICGLLASFATIYTVIPASCVNEKKHNPVEIVESKSKKVILPECPPYDVSVKILKSIKYRAVLEVKAKGESMILSDDVFAYRIAAQSKAEKKIKDKILCVLCGTDFSLNREPAMKIIAQGELVDAEFEIKGNKAINIIKYRFNVPS